MSEVGGGGGGASTIPIAGSSICWTGSLMGSVTCERREGGREGSREGRKEGGSE